MKVKDKYDLNALDVNILYMVDGCGHRTEMKTVQIFHEKNKVKEIITSKSAMKKIFEWLESE